MLKKLGTVAAAVALIGLIFLCQAGGAILKKGFAEGKETSGRAEGKEGYLVIIDAGHGGLDAGKVGVNGEEEKEINLNISLKIEKLLKQQKIDVKMTRTEDERLAESQVEDLKARTDFMNKEKPDLVISIHQNSYHEESVSGAQVFYYTDSANRASGQQGSSRQALEEIDPRKYKDGKRKQHLLYTEENGSAGGDRGVRIFE